MPHARTITIWGLRSTVLLAMLVATFGLGSGQASAQDTIVDKSTTFNALADGQLCTDTCSDVSVHVSPDRTGQSTLVCLAVTSVVDGEWVSEEGCADAAATFSMDLEGLAWAELAPTPVELSAWTCDPDTKTCDSVPTRTVALGASWTGTGDTVRHRETLGNHTGPCTTYVMIDGVVRDAEAAVSIDGAGFTVTGDDVLQVIEETTFRRTNCG